MLATLGLATSIWAEKFDHNAAVTNFVIAPLSLLSGTFYVIENLDPAFQWISRANPFFYVISGFRYGFLGESDMGSSASCNRRCGGSSRGQRGAGGGCLRAAAVGLEAQELSSGRSEQQSVRQTTPHLVAAVLEAVEQLPHRWVINRATIGIAHQIAAG